MGIRYTIVVCATLVLAPPAVAQDETLATRVERVERQLRAVQRTVFADGAASPAGAPPITADPDQRLTAIERRLTELAGESARNAARLQALEQREGTGTQSTAAQPSPDRTAQSGNTARGTDAPPAQPEAAAARTVDARAEAVAAVAAPDTGDAPEDAYTYGYRLYAAKLYPEAEAALKGFLARYPRHGRASYARNLLGRAYLDEGKPALASVTFLENYEKEPGGARAAESLTLLASSLSKLGKTADACRVYAELDQRYGASLSPRLRAQAAKGRTDAACPA